MNRQGEKSNEIGEPKPRRFPTEAFQFVREGLAHTVQTIHGDGPGAPGNTSPISVKDETRHVSGQQLCLGLRDLAIERYGLLAHTVLSRWGIAKTDDFGAVVYAMIERGELRGGSADQPQDFVGVYDFREAFEALVLS